MSLPLPSSVHTWLPRNSLLHPRRPDDLVCWSHLRWNFVFQRPQHLMSRFARERRVFYWEEPVFDADSPTLSTHVCPKTGVNVVTPHIPKAPDQERNEMLRSLAAGFVRSNGLEHAIAWFYTPMALEFFPSSMTPCAVVYDCMDELSNFKGAAPQLPHLETKLLQMADLVFTGGVSLFEAKRSLHRHVHAFPSGVDVAHFQQSRQIHEDFAEQKHLPRPRLGYAGVIDERMDLELVKGVAERRPDWQLVMIGPVVKIREESLPRLPNLHWLGMKDYADLPLYFAGWDVALLPFAINDATRFISPTKTPEYLSAGLPVVSTPIRDVVRPYGDRGLVRIARTTEEFVEAGDRAITEGRLALKWRERADGFLRTLSWDAVWNDMNTLIVRSLEAREKKPVPLPRSSHAPQERAAGV